MPYKSKAQAAYFNIHRKQLESQGVNVSEWNMATKHYENLPESKSKVLEKKQSMKKKLKRKLPTKSKSDSSRGMY